MPTTTRTHVGSRVRERREQLGVSLADAAGALRVTPDDLTAMEEGRAPFSEVQLFVLVSLLRVGVAYFFSTGKSLQDV